MPRALTCPVVLTSASTRSDGSLGLRFATPELSPADKTAFFELLNQSLKMLLQPGDSEPEQLHEVKGEFDPKTPSQRLRGVLYVLWDQQGRQGQFEDYYRGKMTAITDKIKEKLEPQ